MHNFSYIHNFRYMRVQVVMSTVNKNTIVIKNALFPDVNINIESQQCEYSCLLWSSLIFFWSHLLMWQMLYTVVKRSILGHHVFYTEYTHIKSCKWYPQIICLPCITLMNIYVSFKIFRKWLEVFHECNYTYICQQCSCWFLLQIAVCLLTAKEQYVLCMVN